MRIQLENNQLLLKKLILVIYDSAAVIVASLLALFLRFEGERDAIPRQYVEVSQQYIYI